jgi:predicted DNA-binding ribbon-helix-helix protein
MSLSQLVASIDAERRGSNLSSAIRLFVLDFYRPHWPIPAVMAGSRMTAARVTPGAISLSSSSHFALVALRRWRSAAPAPR